MNGQHLYLAIGLPCLTIIVSLLINLIQISGIREDAREIRNDLKVITRKLSGLSTSVRVIEQRLK